MAKNSYKVNVGNSIVVEVHSLDEAAQLVRRLSGSLQTSGQSVNSNSGWTPARFTQFYKSLSSGRKKIVDAWIKYTNGITDEDLIKLLGLKNGKVLGGTLAGFASSAKQIGLGVADVYERRKIRKEGSRVNEYHLTKEFRAVAEKRKRK